MLAPLKIHRLSLSLGAVYPSACQSGCGSKGNGRGGQFGEGKVGVRSLSPLLGVTCSGGPREWRCGGAGYPWEGRRLSILSFAWKPLVGRVP